jgi:hypothetical protein
MEKDYYRIGCIAISWILLLCVSLGFLTGCSTIEGAGFVNTGTPRKGTICEEQSDGHIVCRDK